MREAGRGTVVAVLVALAAGCGSDAPAVGPTITVVKVSATPPTVAVGASSTVVATVSGTGAFDATVAWAIVSGGGSLSATTGPVVTYTAGGVPAGTDVVVKAQSAVDPGKTGSTTIRVAGKPEITAAFTALPGMLPPGGGTVTLSWGVTGADSITIDHGVGAVSGTQTTTTVTADTTFTLTASNAIGSVTATATVTVSPPGVPLWVRQFGSTQTETATGVAVDTFGNVFVAGSTDGALAGPADGPMHAFLVKLDQNGNELWRTMAKDAGQVHTYAVATDGPGNAFITGSAPGGGGGFNAFLTKFDANGTPVWSADFGGPGIGLHGYDEAYGVATDTLGNVTIVGRTNSDLKGASAGGMDAFVARFDPDGNELWRAQLGTAGEDYANAVSCDTSGNVLVAGFANGALAGNSAGAADAFLIKYDKDGVEQWRRQVGTTTIDAAQGVATDSSDNVVVAGYTDGVFGVAGLGNFDFIVVKYDAAGTELWRRQVGTDRPDYGLGVATDGNGEVFAAGYVASNVTADDALLVKWAADGTELWRARLNSIGNGNDRALGVTSDRGGSVYIAGYTFDAVIGTNFGTSGSDAYVAKYR